MTIVKNFPSRLDYGEALIYPRKLLSNALYIKSRDSLFCYSFLISLFFHGDRLWFFLSVLMGDICERIVKRGRDSFEILVDYYKNIVDVIQEIPDDVIFGTIQLLLYLTLMGEILVTCNT